MPQSAPSPRTVLLANPWFATLPQPVQRVLADHGVVRAVAAGESVYCRGDTGDGMYCVLAGAVRLSGTSAGGMEATLDLIEPGNWFGELSMIDGLPRAHDADAHTGCRLLQVLPADFQAMLDGDPAFARHLLQMQSARLRSLLAGVEAFQMQPGEQRFAMRLLSLARSYGVETPQGLEIDLPLSQELISQLIGVSRQRVNQILRLCEREGLLAQHYGRITVLNMDGLRRLVR